jgi:hypothetical protein
MVHYHFLETGMLKYLNFADNENLTNKNSPNYNRFWKLRRISDINLRFSVYWLTEHLSIDEIIVCLKGKVGFRQYIPKKHKHFGIKLYKFYDRTGYTFDMNVSQ